MRTSYPASVSGSTLCITSPKTGRVLSIPFMFNENCDPTGVVGIPDPTPDANADKPEDRELNALIGLVVRAVLEDEHPYAHLTPGEAREFIRASESN